MQSIASLAVENQDRGRDATGFFASTGEIVKKAIAARHAIASDEFQNYLRRNRQAWFMAGHTRLGTRGANIDQNAHPFQYGNYIGSHNGMVNAPREYIVDSEQLIDCLNVFDGDYQNGFLDVYGSWGLTWTDGDSFYTQNHHSSLSILTIEEKSLYYYSSEPYHLRKVFGNKIKTYSLKEGETWKWSFINNKIIPKKLPDLKFKFGGRSFAGSGKWMPWD